MTSRLPILCLVAALLAACGHVAGTARPAASTRARIAADVPTGLVISWDKPSLHPLPDKAKDVEASAERTTMTVEARRDGAPVPGARIHLTAGFDQQSGGHHHDESHRPVGAFYNPKGLGADTTVTANAAGQVRLTYRASGIGGLDVVTASTADGLTGRGELPVAFELTQMPDPGPDDHYKLVGQTADHPVNHGSTPATQALMKRLADAYFKLYNADFAINDESLPTGGPFDLGPAYGVPYWTLTSKHENHRQGISTDVKLGNKQWRQTIERLGGSVFVEENHWHITTVPKIPGPGAAPAGGTLAVGVRYQRATNTIAYDYQLAGGQPAVFALQTGAPVLASTAPKGWSGGAYSGRPLFSFSGDAAPGSFQLVSKGLPALQTAYTRGDTSIPTLDGMPAAMSEEAFAVALDIQASGQPLATYTPADVTTDAPLPTLVRFLRQQAAMARLDDSQLAAAERAAQAGDKAGVQRAVQAFAAAHPGAAPLLAVADVILAR